MTLSTRLTALERRHPSAAWDVIAEAWGSGDDETVYVVCGRWPGEPSREMTPTGYRRFAAEHPVHMLRIYCRGSCDGAAL